MEVLKCCPFCGGKANPLMEYTVVEEYKRRFSKAEIKRSTRTFRYNKERDEAIIAGKEIDESCEFYTSKTKIVDKSYYVECVQCHANIIGNNIEEAINIWNKRINNENK